MQIHLSNTCERKDHYEKFATLKFRKNLAIGMKWLLRWYWNKNKTRRKPKTRQDAR